MGGKRTETSERRVGKNRACVSVEDETTRRTYQRFSEYVWQAFPSFQIAQGPDTQLSSAVQPSISRRVHMYFIVACLRVFVLRRSSGCGQPVLGLLPAIGDQRLTQVRALLACLDPRFTPKLTETTTWAGKENTNVIGYGTRHPGKARPPSCPPKGSVYVGTEPPYPILIVMAVPCDVRGQA